MATLTLQMQATVDGFVNPDTDVEWQVYPWGDEITWDAGLAEAFNRTVLSMSGILLSRNMVPGYIDFWTGIAERHADDDRFRFARHVAETDKHVVTSRSLELDRKATTVHTGDVADVVRELKRGREGSLIAFGGVRFARTLVAADLVDELQLYVNPAAAGAGERLFERHTARRLQLRSAVPYECGVVVLTYRLAITN